MAQSNEAGKSMTSSVSMGVTVMDCKMDTTTKTASPRLVPNYDSKGNNMDMSQMPVTPPLVPVVAEISKGKTAHEDIYKTLGALILQNPENRSSNSGNSYESEPERQQTEECASEDGLKGEDLMLNLSFCALGFETLLRLALPSKKTIKKVGSRETKPWYTTRTEARCLGENNIPGKGSVPANIRVNFLQSMCGEDAYKLAAPPYCFRTQM